MKPRFSPRLYRTLFQSPAGAAFLLVFLVASAWQFVRIDQSVPVVQAESLSVNPNYNANSPHWSHINVLDFARQARGIPNATFRNQAFEWLARHVDVIETEMDNSTSSGANTLSTAMHALNPTLKTFGYDYDSTMCQKSGCNQASPTPHPIFSAYPEEYFLHYSQDTQIQLYDLDNQLIETLNITGCPLGQPVSSSCRLQTFVWTQKRWASNLKNLAWRQVTADRFIDQLLTNGVGQPNIIDGMFLDEHGAGFSMRMSFGGQAKIISGGGVYEYGGLVPRDPSVTQTPNALDTAYTADMEAWLAYLRTRLEAEGKFVHINVAEYFGDDQAFSTALAAKGAMTEHLNRPDSNGLSSWAIYENMITKINQISSAGGSVDLSGTWCSNGPGTYSSGNYPTGKERYRMWSLVSYYLAKEPVGSSGKVYFDPNLCIDTNSPTPLDFFNEWLPAYEYNVGQPTGPMDVHQTGTVGCSGSGYKIYSRAYEHGLMLLRPRDAWGCSNFGDSTAVTVPLEEPMQILLPNGTRSDSLTTISLRNGEGVVLLPLVDTTPPAVILDLVVVSS